MKFTHRLLTIKGWAETNYSPSKFEEVKHLGKCPKDGDMFAGYDIEGYIHIFKGFLKEELKINTWYRNKHISSLVYRKRDFNNYGIVNNEESNSLHCFTPENWQEATEEEVKEALIKLAKKKGLKNINKLKFKDPYGDVYEKGEFDFVGNEFTFNNNILFLYGFEIFRDGKWAEILEEEPLSIEERLKRLEEKINGND